LIPGHGYKNLVINDILRNPYLSWNFRTLPKYNFGYSKNIMIKSAMKT